LNAEDDKSIAIASNALYRWWQACASDSSGLIDCAGFGLFNSVQIITKSDDANKAREVGDLMNGFIGGLEVLK
jgi:hypothetical protein